ncbi:ABC transporter [Dacryopinax primogenitus]|uniref:ABC transporter n=1 Tax=Dacryopinax primogenitus (strain DJM 731) TaxID=1858805 RepID=M5FWR1_DACPD|nr:ABC transporter [Dacryopinax primogenitus]EJU00125.1 ABC transporter [Dacryopinax primogenitus]
MSSEKGTIPLSTAPTLEPTHSLDLEKGDQLISPATASASGDTDEKAHRRSSVHTHVGEDAAEGALDKVKQEYLKYDKPYPWYVVFSPARLATRSQLFSYRYQRVPFLSLDVPQPAASLDDAYPSPEQRANIFSQLTYSWVTPMLTLGYARPLEPPDLWKMSETRSSQLLGEKVRVAFERRHKKAEAYNSRLAAGEVSPVFWRRAWWMMRGSNKSGGYAAMEHEWRTVGGKKKASLVLALNEAVWVWFWIGGLAKVLADTSQITSPLVVKALIAYATNSYALHQQGLPTPGVGLGIGYAIILFAMQVIASLGTHMFFYRSTSTGVLLRGALISAIYSRSVHLTNRARATLTNGKLVNHISTDVSRIDFACGFFHVAWAAPIQMIVCLIILLINLGPSALAGFAFFVFATPLQTRAMKELFKMRKKSMVWTDRRAKLLQELLGGMRVIKFFAWEIPFLKRIAEYRAQELRYIRNLLLTRAANNAVAFSLPAFAAVLSFVVYSLAGNQLQPAIIFSSLTLFQLLRLPLMFLPMTLSAIADAQQALSRLYDVFVAETLSSTRETDPNLPVAIDVRDATFTWDAPAPEEGKEGKKGKKQSKRERKAAEKEAAALAIAGGAAAALQEKDTQGKKDRVFQLKDLSFIVPRGQLCAVVGAVGSGKSSLLQGLIGEMRQTSGEVKFGGSVGYCSQTAWIQNATVRNNILFGQPFEEKRYWNAIRDACLEADLEMLPNYDFTEVGERGISLSGGQKQRINIARSIYFGSDIVLLDDPLSALDAHVGKAVFHGAIQGALAGKTRVLVTHALHFLPYVDYIITMVDGVISERGTYQELMGHDGAFARFVREFGSEEERHEQEEEEVIAVEGEKSEDKKKKVAQQGMALMQTEERNTGAVAGSVYGSYLKAGRGRLLIPMLLATLAMMQIGNVMNSYWLVYWQELYWPWMPQGFYMGIYAGWGFFQAISFFLNGTVFAMLTFYASQALHRDAIDRVMHAPMSFFDTTPLGRIMNRFSKDIDTIDNLLGDALRMFCATMSAIIGAVILIGIFEPYFLIAVAVVSVGYYYAALFYRASARELKRLDSILRSSLYAHFSESLSGLATIRAYGEINRFCDDNVKRMDIENRAYWLTVVNQRWLGVRLDFLGTLLTLVVSILAVASRNSISPSQTGVVLSYILMVQQTFGWMVRQLAEVENDMNGVERVVHYAKHVEQEAPQEIPETKPAASWPEAGKIDFNDVVMSYRPGLPPVLKGLAMHVSAGEKIGIVGRTGAGKSSIMVALYRLVEIGGGNIVIDGVDISKIGLADLRSKIAIFPQDPLLFSGTLRTNLDPFGLYDDAKLWDALKRSYLVEETRMVGGDPEKDEDVPSGAQSPVMRFNLDSTIDDEGANLSVGQRSLVSLARALVKDSRVIVLDEATASVDYETDQKIQDTIAREFHDRTMLIIAHRLKTIIGCDRICVMDAGRIAEFDSPANLWEYNGIFRSMAERSSITFDDIVAATKARGRSI